MTIEFLTQLGAFACTKLEKPLNPIGVLNNILRVSIWSTLATSSVAAVSAVFSRGVIERDAIAPYVFKASLISCGTLAAFTAFIIYKCIQDKNAGEAEAKKLSAHIAYLQKGLSLACAITLAAAILTRDFLNPNQMIKSLAERSIHPLLWIGITSFALRNFYLYQQKQLGNK